MLYAFTGLDAGGKKRSGTLEADGMKEARTKLKADGIYITSIREEKATEKSGFFASVFQRKVPQKELTSFFRQVASLLTAGIPLMETLEATQKQSASPTFKKIINGLREDIRQGEPLATAMEKHETAFDGLTASMVRAGETGGNLAAVLTRIADFKEASLRRESAVKSATVYPVVMAIFGAGVIIFLMGYVVPKIIVIFEDLEQALPLSTTILIIITKIIVGYGYQIGLALCLALFVLARFLKTKTGRKMGDRVLTNAPIVGPIVRAAALARWSHTTSVLLASGVPLLRTLQLSSEVTDNTLYAEAIEDAAKQIREGGSIAPSLERSGLFPPVALQMIAAGEKSGQAAQLLKQVAEDQSAELENSLTVLMSLIQPVLITVLGLMVGFIVMAILLPIFEISQLIG
jgi:general secretion pathway protein F